MQQQEQQQQEQQEDQRQQNQYLHESQRDADDFWAYYGNEYMNIFDRQPISRKK